MPKKPVSQMLVEGLALEHEAATEAEAVGYMCRVLVQATMPHSRKLQSSYERHNGALSVKISSFKNPGLPYGPKPRLVLVYLATQAVKTKSRVVELDDTFGGFMSSIGFPREQQRGGKRGALRPFRDQLQRLFSSTISYTWETDTEIGGGHMPITSQWKLWWDPMNPQQASLWASRVTLGEDFYREIIDRPVPVDMRAIEALRGSSMALDIYCWLSYRMSYLSKRVEIPWGVLQIQFGADYKHVRQFKAKFLKHLQQVLMVYPDANVEQGEYGLVLLPSRPHIPRKAR